MRMRLGSDSDHAILEQRMGIIMSDRLGKLHQELLSIDVLADYISGAAGSECDGRRQDQRRQPDQLNSGDNTRGCEKAAVRLDVHVHTQLSESFVTFPLSDAS